MEKRSYTLEVKGEMNTDFLPMAIGLNGEFFQLSYFNKNDFHSDNLSALHVLRKEIIQNETNAQPQISVSPVTAEKINGDDFITWFISYPSGEDGEEFKLYFLQRAHNDHIHQFTHKPFQHNDDLTALRFLKELNNGLRFYPDGIDIERLRKTAENGKTFYTD